MREPNNTIAQSTIMDLFFAFENKDKDTEAEINDIKYIDQHAISSKVALIIGGFRC